jgi:hypothetical protein
MKDRALKDKNQAEFDFLKNQGAEIKCQMTKEK